MRPAVGVPPYGRAATIAAWTSALCATSSDCVIVAPGKPMNGPSHEGACWFLAPTAIGSRSAQSGMRPASGNMFSVSPVHETPFVRLGPSLLL